MNKETRRFDEAMVDGICRELLVTEVSSFACDPVDSNQTDCLLFYVLITANGKKWEGLK